MENKTKKEKYVKGKKYDFIDRERLCLSVDSNSRKSFLFAVVAQLIVALLVFVTL